MTTVKGLIHILEKLDPDAEVRVSTYKYNEFFYPIEFSSPVTDVWKYRYGDHAREGTIYIGACTMKPDSVNYISTDNWLHSDDVKRFYEFQKYKNKNI